MTISCNIGLSPKESIEQYKLEYLYGYCEIPSRPLSISADDEDALDSISSLARKKRSLQNDDSFDNDNSKQKITKTVNISKKSSTKSNAFRNNTFSISFSVIAILMF